MRNFIIHLSFVLCLFANEAVAQETFENRAKAIAEKIDAITKEEKDALKAEVEAVNGELDEKKITREEADQKKLLLAETRAKNIETRVAVEQENLNRLIKDQIDGKLQDNDSTKTYRITFRTAYKNKQFRGEARTTSQFVFAAGVNNLVTDGAVANSDYRYWGSHFYEWGVSWNTRLLKNDNLLHAKYGVSVMYNNLRPTDNRYFEEDGDQTNLITASIPLKDSRFRNVNVVVPVHLEFDFTKKKIRDDKVLFKTHESFRFGIGGFAGVNVKSKQILKFDDADGNSVTQKTKGNFNTNDFVYGLSSYVGYGSISLYAKYDLSPLFKDNPIDQRNVSLGVRFDLN